MDEETARKILGKRIKSDNGLFDGVQYLAWSVGHKEIVLDDRFTVDELEAIVWWVRNHNTENPS